MQKWLRWATTADAPLGPKQPRSTVLTPLEEAAVVAFRRHTLLPLGDSLYALQPTIPYLTRSSLREQYLARAGGWCRTPFLDAYNYARRLKTLCGLTPYEFVCKSWTEQPQRFTRDPTPETLGPNI